MTIAVERPMPQSDTPYREVAPTALRVLAELTAHATPSGVARVKVSALARAIGVSERTVQRATGQLLESGHLEGVQRGVRWAPNTYRLRA